MTIMFVQKNVKMENSDQVVGFPMERLIYYFKGKLNALGKLQEMYTSM